MVIRGGLEMTLPGIAMGVGVALAGGRLIANQLYGVSPRDPMVVALCASVLVAVAIVACLAPARRATRIDPNDILRAE
jgi:ABC-type antimicrobial peptide transport system permease subunit